MKYEVVRKISAIESQPTTSHEAPAHKLSLKGYTEQFMENHPYRDKAKKSGLTEHLEAQAKVEWTAKLKEQAMVGALSDEAIESYVETFGEGSLHSTFRGVYAKGIEKWIPKDVMGQPKETTFEKLTKRYNKLERQLLEPDYKVSKAEKSKIGAKMKGIAKAVEAAKTLLSQPEVKPALTSEQKKQSVLLKANLKKEQSVDPAQLETQLDKIANSKGLVLKAKKTGASVAFYITNPDGATLIEVHTEQDGYNVNGFHDYNNGDAISRVNDLLSGLKFQVADQPSAVEIAEAEKQMSAVRAKYEGTEQWMKAPNGKPSNLNERQWLQVRTKAFKDWFGDWENDPKSASKVVDENGEPMVVYHSSPESFTVFDITKSRSYTGTPDYDLPGVYLYSKD